MDQSGTKPDDAVNAPPADITALGAENAHLLIDAAKDPVIALDAKGRLCYWNPGAARLFGYEFDEVMGKPLADLLGNDKTALPLSSLEGNHTVQALTKDGSKVWLDISLSPWTHLERTFFAGIIRNVTDRRRREARLARRSANESAIAEISARLMGAPDLDSALVESLRDIAQACGCQRASLFRFERNGEALLEVAQWSFSALGGAQKPSTLARPSTSWTAAAARAGRAVIVTDLSELPADAAVEKNELARLGVKAFSLAPISVGGEVFGFIRIDHTLDERLSEPVDPTFLAVCSALIGSALERAAVAGRLSESEVRHRLLFESAPISMWRVDYSEVLQYLEELRAQGVTDFKDHFNGHPEDISACLQRLIVNDVNKATLDLYKAASKEYFLRGLESVFTEESLPGFGEELVAFANGKRRYEGENQSRTLDGRTIHNHIKTFALPGYEKTMSEVYCALTDITERKQADVQAQKRIAYEQAISNLATRFVAPPDLNKAINVTLREIARFTHADAFLGFFDLGNPADDRAFASLDDAPPDREAYRTAWRADRFSRAAAKLRVKEAVHICDIPRSADPDLDEFETLGVKSVLIMPVHQGEKVVAGVGLSTGDAALRWGEETVSLLLVASSIIGSALERETNDEAMRESEHKYRSLIESAGDAIVIADIQTGLIIDANKEAEELMGRPASEIIGMHQKQLHPADEGERYERVFREQIEQGRKLSTDPNLCVVHKSGRRIPVEIATSRIEVGNRLLVQGIFHNISERQRARELRDALNKIMSLINSTLNFEAVTGRVLTEAQKALRANSAVSLVLDGDSWLVKDAPGYPPDLVGQKFDKKVLGHLDAAVSKRGPLAINDAPNDERINQDLVETFGLKSVLTIPLILRSECLGCLTFCRHERTAPFTEAEIDFARQMGAAASFAVENARLYSEKRNIADALQQSLLTMPKSIQGIRFGNLYRAATKTARVGGDFYDVFELDDDTVGLIVGDVSGKGLEAAKLTSLVKNTIRAYASDRHAPAEVIQKTNAITLRFSEPSTFVTVFFGQLDKRTGELRYCCAGHPSPFVKRGPGRIEILGTQSPAIGILPEFTFTSDSHILDRGDTLFLYTDGATDARRDNELFGEERLKKLVADIQHKTTEELPHLLFAELLEFSDGEMADDLAMLAVSLDDNLGN